MQQLTRSSAQNFSGEYIEYKQALEKENDKLAQQVLQAILNNSPEDSGGGSNSASAKAMSLQNNEQQLFHAQLEEAMEESKEVTTQTHEMMDTELALKGIKTQMDNLNESI